MLKYIIYNVYLSLIVIILIFVAIVLVGYIADRVDRQFDGYIDYNVQIRVT